MTASDRIKEIRKENGLNQAEFGNKIGVSRDVIANIEGNRIEVKDIHIIAISNTFGVSESWLRYGIEPKQQEPSDDFISLAADLDFSIDECDEKMKEMMSYLLKTWKALDPDKKTVLIEVINELLVTHKKEKE